jgi:hypothetical protein
MPKTDASLLRPRRWGLSNPSTNNFVAYVLIWLHAQFL